MKSKSVITPPNDSEKKKGRFSALAEIIGFITDSKEIISTLFSLLGITSLLASISEGRGIKLIFTNFAINPWFSFALWWLAIYTFLGFARREWGKNQESKRYCKSFSGFILRDLLFGFKNIPYSVLSISFCILFVWNIVSILTAYSVSKEQVLQLTPLTPYLIVPLIFLLLLISGFFNERDDGIQKNITQQSIEDFKFDVKSNWEKWDIQIQLKMNNSQWISVRQFEDVKTLYSVGDDQIEWLMSRYAVEYPGAAHYGYIHNMPENRTIPGGKYLVNTRLINRSKYCY
jgi:hypothetical protein